MALTGTTQLGVREYDPSLGRLTVDPVLAPMSPQQTTARRVIPTQSPQRSLELLPFGSFDLFDDSASPVTS